MSANTMPRSRRAHRRTAIRAVAIPCVEAMEIRRLLSGAAAVPAVDATNPGGAPNAPFALNVTSGSVNTAQFSFVDSADNETAFVISRSVNGGPLAKLATLAPSTTPFATVTFTDSNLATGSDYSYTATAVNGPYDSSTPPPVTFHNVSTTPTPTPNPGGAPNAPFGLSAQPNTTRGGVTFKFFDSASNETGFVVERATSAGGPFTQLVALPPSTNGLVSYDDLTATPGTTYFYTAFATNGPYVSSTPAAVSATAAAVTVTGSVPVHDTSYQFSGGVNSAGDFQDVNVGGAARVAVTTDGSRTYAMGPAAIKGNNDAHIFGPIIDWTTPTGQSGQIIVNQLVPVAIDTPTRTAGLAVQADGKVLVAGNSGANIVVARFNADGTLDKTFGNAGGELVVNYGGNEKVADMALGADGKIYVGGTHEVYQQSANEFFVIRLNADGSIDRSFGFNGISKGDPQDRGSFPPIGGSVKATALAVDDADGSVIIVGSRSQGMDDLYGAIEVARLTPAGTAMDTVTIVGNRGGGPPATAEDVIVQPDRKFVVVGLNGQDLFSRRFNSNATIDASWVGPGQFLTGPIDLSAINGIARLADGSYVIVGLETPNQTTNFGVIAHLNAADGTVINAPDGSSGIISYQPADPLVGAFTTSYFDVAVAPDQSIYAAGQTHGWLLISKYRLA